MTAPWAETLHATASPAIIWRTDMLDLFEDVTGAGADVRGANTQDAMLLEPGSAMHGWGPGLPAEA